MSGKKRCDCKATSNDGAGISLLGLAWRCVQNQICVNPGLRRGRIWGGFRRGGRDDARAARQCFDLYGVVGVVVIVVVVVVVFISLISVAVSRDHHCGPFAKSLLSLLEFGLRTCDALSICRSR